MKKLLTLTAILLTGACADSVVLNDHKDLIDSNTARIALLELSDSIQDTRLGALESKSQELDGRLVDVEFRMDNAEADISDLFDRVDILDQGLVNLRNHLHWHVAQLQQTDRNIRQELRSKVRSLRRDLSREIRQRRLADNNLQNQIDSVENDLDAFQSQQRVTNFFMSLGLTLTNLRINQLTTQVNNRLSSLDSRLTTVEGDITTINGELSALQGVVNSLGVQLDSVEDRLISVVYPCGPGSSQEILLQTEDGLLAYFQQTRTITETFAVGDTVPEHFVCDRFIGNSNVCLLGHNVPAASTSQSLTVSHQVLEKAYLDILGDGSYATSDGYSCNFSVANGELQ